MSSGNSTCREGLADSLVSDMAADFQSLLARPLSARETQKLSDALQGQSPVLICDQRGHAPLAAVPLDAGVRLVVGRSAAADLAIHGDEFASAAHLELLPRAGYWMAEDLGSTNGTRIRGEQLTGRRLLRHEDVIEIGSRTRLVYLASQADARTPPLRAPKTDELTGRERDVLAALAIHRRRDFAAGPASNEEIARELKLGLETVRTHIKSLYRKTGIASSTPDRRLRLAMLGLTLAPRSRG